MNKTHKDIFQSNNYLILDNFIESEKAEQLYKELKEDIKNNPQAFHVDDQCPKSTAIYNYQPFLNILCKKIKNISDVMEESMLPTYTYARLYKNSEILEKHTDRPSCEISITLHLGGDHEWPIWMTKPNGEEVSIELKPGQAIMYQGMVSPHWRDEFEGTEYGQVFLHYVRGEGIYWEHYGDRING
jgi:hypothetical protein